MRYVTVDDVSIPALGLGTYRMTGNECTQACRTAIEKNYRHIDSAQMYNNESAVGEAVRESGGKREEFFVVTKLRPQNLAYDKVHSSFERSIERLGLDYVDLLLIHSPSQSVPVEDTLRAMNELQDENVVHHIGVSNFSVSQLEEAMSESRTRILTNQVKYNPFVDRSNLLTFCVDHEIMLTAHTPLARQRICGNETLKDIGKKYGKTEAQVTLRWLIQQPMVSVIPKSATIEHQQENMKIFDFDLSTDEMREITNIGPGDFEDLEQILKI